MRVMSNTIEFSTTVLQQTNSTMDRCREAVKNITTPLYVAYRAIEQSAGRGLPDKQTGVSRVWSSPPGNLYLSYTLPAKDVKSTWEATFPAGLLMRQVLEPYLRHGLGITLKWPNDFFMDQQKFGGVLVERYQQHLIVGVGITLNTYPDPNQIRGGAGYNTTRLIDHSDQDYIDPATVASNFLERMRNFLISPPSTTQVMTDIGFLLSTEDPTLRFQLRAAGDKPFPDSAILDGRFVGFCDDDYLKIETKGVVNSYAIRDVLFRLHPRTLGK